MGVVRDAVIGASVGGHAPLTWKFTTSRGTLDRLHLGGMGIDFIPCFYGLDCHVGFGLVCLVFGASLRIGGAHYSLLLADPDFRFTVSCCPAFGPAGFLTNIDVKFLFM